jgi:hypothetical protein
MRKFLACSTSIFMCCAVALGQNFRVIHSFKGYPSDGAHSVADVVFDATGNLYGTTPGGGNSTAPPCVGTGCGAVFEMSPNGQGGWIERVIYSFCSDFTQGSCADGAYPDAGLVLDAAGNSATSSSAESWTRTYPALAGRAPGPRLAILQTPAVPGAEFFLMASAARLPRSGFRAAVCSS